ncbi:mucin-13 [Oryzias melastigma]|uniref:mucin-13 n=1 Tax=Oryzias melastigma TaxID=30732 RepID=UPI000CF801BF|nr:mucin-13 [Oryzias melastigma]
MAKLFSVLGVLWMATALFVFATGEDPPSDGSTPAADTATPPATPGDETPPVTDGTPATGETQPTEGTPATGETPPTEGTPATGETQPTEGSPATGETQPTEGSPATGETDKPETDKPPVTEKPSPCNPNPCGGGSTCEPRADDFVCLCLPGDSYIDNLCQKAKVFPGQVDVPGLTYVEELKDKTSTAFKTESEKIIAKMDKAFEGNTDYIGCVVVEFRQKQTRMTRAGDAEAVVDLSFKSDSDVTGKDVENSINTCEDCGVDFVATDLCERNSCDVDSTKCTASEGSFSCVCQDGYIKSGYTERLCLACPSGQKAVDSESCDDCTFGYSGFNCSENWQLILVIVGAVLGVLTLSFLIALIVVSVKSPKKKSKKKSKEAEDVKPYISHFSTKAPVGGNSVKNDYTSQTNAPAGVPRIPRATTTMDNRNNMEMMPGNSRQNLISSNSWLNEDQDSGYSYSRPNNYAQNRPQSNPYNQNRAQYNPYAQNQGHSNPYYKD